jgi:Protein of unknown function (DUF3040)
MILNARERRILTELERKFNETDPRFVRAMRRSTRHDPGWNRAGCNVVTVLAGLTAILCAALLLIGPTLVAALLAAATYDIPRHFPPGARRAPAA